MKRSTKSRGWRGAGIVLAVAVAVFLAAGPAFRGAPDAAHAAPALAGGSLRVLSPRTGARPSRAALTVVARAILNLDEVITRE